MIDEKTRLQAPLRSATGIPSYKQIRSNFQDPYTGRWIERLIAITLRWSESTPGQSQLREPEPKQERRENVDLVSENALPATEKTGSPSLGESSKEDLTAIDRISLRYEPDEYLRLLVSEQSAAATFKRLAQDWRMSRGPSSFIEKIVMHPSYQRIIGLGPAAVPLILRELAKEPDHWFWALYSITGQDPVRQEDSGDIRLMAQSWIGWGRARGLI